MLNVLMQHAGETEGGKRFHRPAVFEYSQKIGGEVMKKHHSNRSMFSGKLGFVLSAAGASVGLATFGDFRTLRQNTAAAFSF